MKLVCRKLIFSILWIGLFAGAYAEGVPSAIKYQAVLRDVNGRTLAGKEGVNLKISLRKDDPLQGQIVYSEEHLNIATNAYGVIHLEIGRGNVLSGTTLQDVPWADHSMYVQIEVETDGRGYTNMGTSELLSVPYAFMAGSVQESGLYRYLEEGYLPRFNAANRTLVNSGLRQYGREVQVDASAVKFMNSALGSEAYTFPSGIGRKGQVMVLADNQGTLEWGDMSGGTGTVSDPFDNLAGDGRLVYWNESRGVLDTAPLIFRYATGDAFDLGGSLHVSDTVKTRHMTASGTVAVGGDLLAPNLKVSSSGMEINTQVTGTHNLMTRSLGDARVWIGDGMNLPQERVLNGHVLLDRDGKTSLNLVLKGDVSLIPGTLIDTLAVEGGQTGGDSLWLRNSGDDHLLYACNKGLALAQTKVGIGTDQPEAMLHVAEGDVLFSAGADAAGNFPKFRWNVGKGALRAGALSTGSQAWDDANTGSYSMALGLDAIASGENSFALGQNATVLADIAFAVGKESSVGGEASFAIGNEAHIDAGAAESFAIGNLSAARQGYAIAVGRAAEADGEKSMAIGLSARAKGDNAVVLGPDSEGDKDAVVLGRANTTSTGTVVVGSENTQISQSSIVLGTGNSNPGTGSVIVGRNNTNIPKSSVVLGSVGAKPTDYDGPIVVGGLQGTAEPGLIAVGRNLKSNNQAITTVLLGSDIINALPEGDELVVIGNNIDTQNDRIGSASSTGYKPIFMFGSMSVINEFGTAVALEIVEDGSAHFIGKASFGDDVDVNGAVLQTSDYRLKTDIRPVSYPLSLLDSLRPVTFRYKADKQQKQQIGFIAQEVRKYFPTLVSANAKGILSMNYIGLVPVLWQMNRQLVRQVEEIEKSMEEQKRSLEEKDRKIAELESTLNAEIQAIKAKIGL